MKKFISALSSLAIAATAMGGALAFSADAATNTKVDDTIISFRSNGKNEVIGEKGKTVPVSVYIPQSSGFHSINLKFAINGKETLAQVFTDCRYTKKDNEAMSAGLLEALRRQGFID